MRLGTWVAVGFSALAALVGLRAGLELGRAETMTVLAARIEQARTEGEQAVACLGGFRVERPKDWLKK